MDFVKIQKKRELELINLDQVCSISIADKSITVRFVKAESIMYTEIQLGAEEFKKLKGVLNTERATPRAYSIDQK